LVSSFTFKPTLELSAVFGARREAEGYRGGKWGYAVV
jgi:hypothetical protein